MVQALVALLTPLRVAAVAVIAGIAYVTTQFTGPAAVPPEQASAPPVVESVTISQVPYGPAADTIVIDEATGVPVYVHGTVSDPDGCNEIAGSSQVQSHFCGGSGDCYAFSSATVVDECTSESDVDARYMVTFLVTPISSNIAEGDEEEWQAEVTVRDAYGESFPDSSSVALRWQATLADLPTTVAATPIAPRSVSSEQGLGGFIRRFFSPEDPTYPSPQVSNPLSAPAEIYTSVTSPVAAPPAVASSSPAPITTSIIEAVASNTPSPEATGASEEPQPSSTY